MKNNKKLWRMFWQKTDDKASWLDSAEKAKSHVANKYPDRQIKIFELNKKVELKGDTLAGVEWQHSPIAPEKILVVVLEPKNETS